MWHIDIPVMLDKSIYYFHAVSLGYFLGSDVRVSDDGIYFMKTGIFESVFFTSDGGFRGISLVPVFLPKQVADFRDLLIIVFLKCDTALTNEFSITFFHDSP